MQALVVLSTVFALLAGYLEWWAPSHQPESMAATHLVIRTAAPAVVTTPDALPIPLVAKRSTETRSTKPLNLALPSTLDAEHTSLNQHNGNGTLRDLFERRTERERVTYNAELVFDRESGEDITGGKVNIKIPLS